MDNKTSPRQARLGQEKHVPLTTEVSVDEEHGNPQSVEWNPGYLSRFPWLGIGSLLGVLACVAVAIVTLMVSDGRSQSKWPKWIAPNVILSGINSASNICLAIAIGNGVAIAWWRKTLQGASIGKLHQSWAFSKSMLDIAKAGRAFNFIALATLIAKFAFVDSLLMQSATSTEIRPEQPRVVNITGFANETWPFTGRVIGASGQPGLLTSWFQGDLLTWTQNPAVFSFQNETQNSINRPFDFEGCNGTCTCMVPAIGFQFDCNDAVATPVVFNASTMDTSSFLNRNGTLKSHPLFSLSFNLQWNSFNMDPNADAGPPANITMNIVHTESRKIVGDTYGSCSAFTYNQTCVLRPSIINYPAVVVDTLDQNKNGQATIALSSANAEPFDAAEMQQPGFGFARYNDIWENHALGGSGDLSQLAGIQQALTMYLGGDASVSFDGRYNWLLSQDGNAAKYLLNQPSVEECNWNFTNPLVPGLSTSAVKADSVVTSINQIMFALALDISGSDPNNIGTSQIYQATQYADGIHYKTHIWYMIGAAISTFIVVMCVFPVYYGYWELGRKVTLGPVEIAHAFRSPMTAQATSGDIDGLVKQVGHREVQFGHIVTGDAAGVVGIAEPEYVARLQSGGREFHRGGKSW